MEFLVLIAYESSGWDEATAEQQQEFFDAHHAFEQAVQHLPRQYTLEVRPVVDIDGYERSAPPRA